MKSKVSSEEPTGEIDVTKGRRLRQGQRFVADTGELRAHANLCLRSFYTSLAKFTSPGSVQR
jgi:hypothetical protein